MTDKTDWAGLYLEGIRSGEITVDEEIRAVYERLHREANDPAFAYEYRPELGNHAIKFIETFCRHYQGEHAGELVQLALFQKAFVQSLFGWVDKEAHLRRFIEYFFEVARKHGKSFLSACIAVYMMVADGEQGAEIYTAATKLDQAKIIYTAAKNIIDQSPDLRALVKSTREGLEFKMTRSIMKVS